MNPLFLVLFVAAGLFSIAGGVMDWDFFMNNYRAQRLVRIIGRPAARVFYVALGVVLLVASGGLYLTGTPL